MSARDEPTLGIEKLMGQEPLVGLKNLKPASGILRVVLAGYEVDDSDLQALADWKGLEVIDVIDGKKVGDNGVKAIARLPKLREVVLADTAVSGIGVSALSSHVALTRLTLTNTVFPSQVKTLALKNLPKLEVLELACEGGISDVRLAAMPRLRELSAFPSDVKSAEISGLGAITELDFRGSKLEKLSISDMPSLESIDLRDTQVNDETVMELKKKFPKAEIRR